VFGCRKIITAVAVEVEVWRHQHTKGSTFRRRPTIKVLTMVCSDTNFVCLLHLTLILFCRVPCTWCSSRSNSAAAAASIFSCSSAASTSSSVNDSASTCIGTCSSHSTCTGSGTSATGTVVSNPTARSNKLCWRCWCTQRWKPNICR
jgi:hypothetical protein